MKTHIIAAAEGLSIVDQKTGRAIPQNSISQTLPANSTQPGSRAQIQFQTSPLHR